jgi:tetratricopeptide (TPR) repeat protein
LQRFFKEFEFEILIMRNVFCVLGFVFFSFLISCAPAKQVVVVVNYGQQAEADFNAGNFDAALTGYENAMAANKSQGAPIDGVIYRNAGLAALELKQTPKAIEYLEVAKYTPAVDAETWAGLAKCYREIDNLSKEMTAIENYLENYPEGKEVGAFRVRLFELYVESENWPMAFDLWPPIAETAGTQLKLLNDYFKVNRKLGNDQNCDELAPKMLQLDDKNLVALEWQAKKYYWKAEDFYQAEMKAYENNKTNKQYLKLLESLKLATADFKISLGYFERLYAISPKPDFANYIGNIYARFDDKKNAEFYHEKGKK